MLSRKFRCRPDLAHESFLDSTDTSVKNHFRVGDFAAVGIRDYLQAR